jgi:transmembrane sensor
MLVEKNKYSQFKSSDFILDEDFQIWINDNDLEQNRFWSDWLQKNPNKQAETKKAREILLAMNFKDKTISKGAIDEAWRKQRSFEPESQPENSEYTNKRRLKISKTFIKVAATVALLLISYFGARVLIPHGEDKKVATITKTVTKGHKLILTLADGTKIKLNAGSTISYPENFSANERKIELSGEAFFKVASNPEAPFTVVTGNVETRVLGTSFNVKAYPEKELVYVAVVEGKVRVSSLDPNKNVKADVELIPNQLATIPKNEGEILVSPFDKELLLAWRHGNLYFEQSNFEDVINDLERWYGVSIELSKSKKINPEWRFSGHFENRSLEYVLNVFSYPERFSFQIEGNKILIN